MINDKMLNKQHETESYRRRGTSQNQKSTPALVSPQRILVIDDDAATCALVQQILTLAGYEVEFATSGQAGLKLYATFHPQLIILDVNMPGMNGVEVCRRLRQHATVPVIFLSANEDETVMLQGFNCDALDYITKPFKRRILLARVKIALQHGELTAATRSATIYNDGYLEIDPATHRISVNGELIQLTKTELALLRYLMQHADAYCSIESILASVWGDGYQDAVAHVYTYIRRLRHKLERDPKHPQTILSAHGQGYRFKRQNNP